MTWRRGSEGGGAARRLDFAWFGDGATLTPGPSPRRRGGSGRGPGRRGLYGDSLSLWERRAALAAGEGSGASSRASPRWRRLAARPSPPAPLPEGEGGRAGGPGRRGLYGDSLSLWERRAALAAGEGSGASSRASPPRRRLTREAARLAPGGLLFESLSARVARYAGQCAGAGVSGAAAAAASTSAVAPSSAAIAAARSSRIAETPSCVSLMPASISAICSSSAAFTPA